MRELIDPERGRWVIDDQSNFPLGGFWCHPETLPTLSAARKHNKNAAVVLTEEESNRPIGNLSLDELDGAVRSLWGSDCVMSYSSRPYNRWLSYFITQEQCTYGEVHAWFAAFSTWQDRFPYYEPGRVQQLRFPRSYNTSRLVDGFPHQKLKRLTILDEQGNSIINLRASDLRPRRLWDVCANKIVPSTWYPSEGYRLCIRPISHAWVNDDDLEYVWTNVNQFLWPVPLPRGVTLEVIRADLVELNVRYAWVDVLCLRQKIQPSPRCPAPPFEITLDMLRTREEQRLQEWATDIPTIGMVYDLYGGVIVYLSGLGREFQPQGWTHPRHWLRRVWTLQETRDIQTMEFGGLRGKTINPMHCVIDNRHTTLGQYLSKLLPLSNSPEKLDIGFLIREIQHREASNPVDRVASLVYLYRGASGSKVTRPILPVYNPSESPDAAWVRLLSTFRELDLLNSDGLDARMRLEIHLLMLFPTPGPEHWYPTWSQFLDFPELSYEPQLPDGTPPQVDTPLRINSGRLYRGCALHQVLDQFGEPAMYTVTRNIDGNPTRDGSPWDGIHLVQTTSGGLPEIPSDAGQTYVLIDITPQKLNFEKLHWFIEPMWLYHVILICRELTPWIQPEEDPEPRVRKKDLGTTPNLPDDGRSKYLLQRVSTLHWIAPSTMWLPVKECLGTRRLIQAGCGTYTEWKAQFDVCLQ